MQKSAHAAVKMKPLLSSEGHDKAPRTPLTLLGLPVELLIEILGRVEFRSGTRNFCHLRLVCKHLHSVLETHRTPVVRTIAREQYSLAYQILGREESIEMPWFQKAVLRRLRVRDVLEDFLDTQKYRQAWLQDGNRIFYETSAKRRLERRTEREMHWRSQIQTGIYIMECLAELGGRQNSRSYGGVTDSALRLQRRRQQGCIERMSSFHRLILDAAATSIFAVIASRVRVFDCQPGCPMRYYLPPIGVKEVNGVHGKVQVEVFPLLSVAHDAIRRGFTNRLMCLGAYDEFDRIQEFWGSLRSGDQVCCGSCCWFKSLGMDIESRPGEEEDDGKEEGKGEESKSKPEPEPKPKPSAPNICWRVDLLMDKLLPPTRGLLPAGADVLSMLDRSEFSSNEEDSSQEDDTDSEDRA